MIIFQEFRYFKDINYHLVFLSSTAANMTIFKAQLGKQTKNLLNLSYIHSNIFAFFGSLKTNMWYLYDFLEQNQTFCGQVGIKMHKIMQNGQKI